MTKHFVLKLNPNAKFEWERCALHHPITAEQPSLALLVADAVGGQAGSYLVSIKLEVNILEQEDALAINAATYPLMNGNANLSANLPANIAGHVLERPISLSEDFQIPALADCAA